MSMPSTFKPIADLTPSGRSKVDVIAHYIGTHPTPDPDYLPNLVLIYTVSINGSSHTRYYQPATGKVFTGTNYFLDESVRGRLSLWSIRQLEEYKNYTPFSPAKYNNGYYDFSYIKPIEDFEGYRMLELSTVRIYAKKMNKALNLDKRDWKFTNGSSYPEKYGIVAASRAFMFAGDPNLYDQYGDELAPDTMGKFYNKTVQKWLTHYVWGKNSDLYTAYRLTQESVKLFATGTTQETSGMRFDILDWYKNIKTRTVSKKSIDIESLANAGDKLQPLSSITTKYPWKIDMSTLNTSDEIFRNFMEFEKVNDDWDILRVFRRVVDTAALPDVPAGHKFRSSSYYVSELDKIAYNAQLIANKTSSDIVTYIPDSVQETARILINHKKHESYCFQPEKAKLGKFVKKAISYRYFDNKSHTEFVNPEEAKSNPNLSKALTCATDILLRNSSMPLHDINLPNTLHNIAKSKTYNDIIDEYPNIAKALISDESSYDQSPDRLLKRISSTDTIKTSDTLSSLLGFSETSSVLSTIDKFLKDTTDREILTTPLATVKVGSFMFYPGYNVDYGTFNILTAAYSRPEIEAMSAQKLTNVLNAIFLSTTISSYTGFVSLGGPPQASNLIPGIRMTQNYADPDEPYLFTSCSRMEFSRSGKEYLKKFLERYVKAQEDKDLDYIKGCIKIAQEGRTRAGSTTPTKEKLDAFLNCDDFYQLRAAAAKYGCTI